jgi:hypothetical protein|tara:strand:+ start:184 stop:288 length:105 start_codon:yes stop_codon:yes gene_type:complete
MNEIAVCQISYFLARSDALDDLIAHLINVIQTYD